MKKKKPQLDDDQLDLILREAGILAGFPVTKRAVEETESQAMPPLPAHLLDPSVVFNRKRNAVAMADSAKDKSETLEQLHSLAARNGTELSEETQKQMEIDRTGAESELDEGKDG